MYDAKHTCKLKKFIQNILTQTSVVLFTWYPIPWIPQSWATWWCLLNENLLRSTHCRWGSTPNSIHTKDTYMPRDKGCVSIAGFGGECSQGMGRKRGEKKLGTAILTYCYFLLQGIFLIQESNSGLRLGWWTLYQWATWEAPILQQPGLKRADWSAKVFLPGSLRYRPYWRLENGSSS